MLLYQIYVLGLLLLLCDPDRVESSQSLMKEIDESLSIPVDENSFETAHRIPNVKEEFETSHKISSASDSQYRNVDENAESSLMQLQQTQNLFSTKERPELSPILSALINEDVMKSIEAKRAIEQQQLDAVSAEIAMLQTTEGLSYVLTTSKPSLDKNTALEDEANVGLVDQPINLESAGSENNQKSRIQIKKGPNGMDYEYEYVYYYYDDDEAAESKKYQEAEPTIQGTNKKGTQPLERGKSRYTNIERSTTSAPDNTLVSGKAKGRAHLDDSNTVDEGRLPVMTRFPSRGKNIEANPTDSLDGFGNVASASIEKSQKIGVKRPSLELVDSETFNTDEKQIKGSPRNGDSEKTTPSAVENIDAKETKKEETSDEKALLAEEVDQTTPLMEKSALDLYAILARENLEIEMTTDLNKVITTDLPDSTESDDYGITTVEPETDTVIPATSSSTSTTTTTEEPTSTTSTPTTTTTTTTTLAPSLFGAGRRGIATTGRNRFRLKSGTGTAGPATATVNEAPAAPAADLGNTNGIKERNRFQRPSLSSRKGTFTTSPAPSAAEEEVIAKEIDKPVVSSSPVRGRTRNRFNLRGQSSTTTTILPVKDSEENDVSTTTVRSLRARPALNLHGRSRVGTRSKAAPPSSDKEEISSSVTVAAPEINDEKTSPSSLPTRPSRFNLSRTGGSPGSNRLFPRPRLNPVRSNPKSSTAAEEPEKAKTIKGDEEEEEEKEESDDSGKPESDSITAPPATGGLNRLKSRPRLQIQTKSDNKPKALPITARKVNPLFARKKIVLGSSTTETTISENEEDDRENSALPLDKKDTDSNQFATEEVPENNTELPETTTKLARGLGLLTQRKRLQIRKPGTQL